MFDAQLVEVGSYSGPGCDAAIVEKLANIDHEACGRAVMTGRATDRSGAKSEGRTRAAGDRRMKTAGEPAALML
jgi:hypothetical protein